MINHNLIAVEGLDGAGKSTLVEQLSLFTRAEGRSVSASSVWDRYGWGRTARRIIVEHDHEQVTPTERLLIAYSAATAHGRMLRKDPNKLFIVDRHLASVYAYQCLDLEGTLLFADLMCHIPPTLPALTFYLDIGAEESQRRVQARGFTDAVESFDLSFHQGLGDRFKMAFSTFGIMSQQQAMVIRIDATKSPEKVRDEALEVYSLYLKQLYAIDNTEREAAAQQLQNHQSRLGGP